MGCTGLWILVPLAKFKNQSVCAGTVSQKILVVKLLGMHLGEMSDLSKQLFRTFCIHLFCLSRTESHYSRKFVLCIAILCITLPGCPRYTSSLRISSHSTQARRDADRTLIAINDMVLSKLTPILKH